MIKSREELNRYLKEDSHHYKRIIYNSWNVKSILKTFRARHFTTPISDQTIIWNYIKVLRKVEYYSSIKSIFAYPFLLHYVRKYMKLGRVTGFQIPINSIAEGLTIWHYGTIIINPDTRIGKYCTLRPDIVIGHKDSNSESPTIGDNVVINSGVKIIGDIHIGDDVIVAPNAVVTHDIPSHSMVAGVPARIIKRRDSRDSEWKQIFK